MNQQTRKKYSIHALNVETKNIDMKISKVNYEYLIKTWNTIIHSWLKVDEKQLLSQGGCHDKHVGRKNCG